MHNNYDIIKPVLGGTFATQLSSIACQLKGRSIGYAKVLLSDAQNQMSELVESDLYQLLPKAATTAVEQSPLDGSKVAVVIGESLRGRFDALRLTNDEARGLSSYDQTMLLFRRYLALIEPLNLQMETHCVRTWIYVSDIDNNYAGVVEARNDVFAEHGMTAETHYIASTGIGGATDQKHACVAIDFLTYPDICEADKHYLQALTHLNPTHEYGVAFERATKVGQKIFISGTASIDNKGQVLFLGDVEKQTERLQENIAALLKAGGMTLDHVRYFIVYLRDVADYAVVNEYMKSHFPATPYVITLARVCRPTWLIEMECVAEKE